MFISIEGPDQAGKTTQIDLLHNFAKKNNFNWLFTRNPGGSELGKQIREIVLHSDKEICDYAELLLYMADRAQHIKEVISIAKEQKKLIVCDRFLDSSIAYQGFGRQLDLDFINTLNNFICKQNRPDLTILLMISPDEALKRRQHTPDRLEKENKLFHLRVANGFKTIAHEEPDRVKMIEVANKTPQQIHKELMILIKNKAKNLNFTLDF